MLSVSHPQILRPGHKYGLFTPAFAVLNNQVSQGQTGGTVVLKHRNGGQLSLIDCMVGSHLILDGDVYDEVSLATLTNTGVIYFYEGVRYPPQEHVTQMVSGDNFIGSLAAATAKTDRTAVPAPGNFIVRVHVRYSLSLASPIATAGSATYIALINGGQASESIYLAAPGNITGEIVCGGGQDWTIEYENADTVAHYVSAVFSFVVFA